MVFSSPTRRRRSAAFALLGVLGFATTMAAAAVPMSADPKARLSEERSVPPPLPTLTAGRGLTVERAFGPDDEDCMVEVRTVGSGLGLHEIRSLVCADQ